MNIAFGVILIIIGFIVLMTVIETGVSGFLFGTLIIIAGVYCCGDQEVNLPKNCYEYKTEEGITGLSRKCKTYKNGTIICVKADGTLIYVVTYKKLEGK